MSDPDTRCPQCGESVPPAVGSSVPPTHCGRCGAELPPASRPPGLDIESWFAEPGSPSAPPKPPAEVVDLEILDEPAAPPSRSREAAVEPLPDAAFDDDLPLVQPARVAPPSVRRVPSPSAPISQFRPRGREDEPERPKPQIGLAIVALVLMFLVLAAGLTVILYAFWAGFKSLPRPRKAEALPATQTEQCRITVYPAIHQRA